MLVHRIKEFIKELQACEVKPLFDQEFLQSFEANFVTEQDNESGQDIELDVKQIEWILRIFRKRWQKIVDTTSDYTFDPTGINAPWIALALELANVADKSYLQILIPVITNTIDPIKNTPLVECAELRGFYLGEGKTLNRVRGLFERLLNGHAFSTFENSKNDNSRPLSVVELLRIRSKAGDDLVFDIDGTFYINFWDYLRREIMPNWHKTGESPKQVLSELRDLVEDYFAASDNAELHQFKVKFASWARWLHSASIDDVNCLYGQVVQVDEQPVYLIDILLDCLQIKDFDLSAKMLGIARWLCTTDASLVGKHDALNQLYAELHLGPAFGSAQLQDYLLNLQVDASQQLITRIHVVSRQLEKSREIDSKVIEHLSEVYLFRWQKVRDTDDDYTRLTNGINTNWIQLAQRLAGAGLINPNYYRFLMPGLKHDSDPVTQACLTDYSLTHYILSEAGDGLILLDNAAANYGVNGTFLNCNANPPRPFKPVELTRIANAAQQFRRYTKLLLDEKMQERAVSLSTLDVIKDLVNGSLCPNGLLLGQDYSQLQMSEAQKAYQAFYKFLHELPEDERQRLDSQSIIFNGKIMIFREVLAHIKNDGCIAVFGQYFAQLVMDYLPHLHFNPKIEQEVDIKAMRFNTQRKVSREYEMITDSEASRRIQILLLGLMTHQFKHVARSGFLLSVGGYSKRVPREAKAICTFLMSLIEEGDFSGIRFGYASLMEALVKPLLADQNRHNKVILNADLQAWLQSIVNQSLFQKKNCYFEPTSLLIALLSFIQKHPKTYPEIDRFLDLLATNYYQRNNLLMYQITVNLQFVKLFNPLDEDAKQQILLLLDSVSLQQDNISNQTLLLDLTIHRVASLAATSEAWQAGFFAGKEQRFDQGLYDELSARFKDARSVQQLQATLVLVMPSIHTTAQGRVNRFWRTMTGRALGEGELTLVSSPREIVVRS